MSNRVYIETSIISDLALHTMALISCSPGTASTSPIHSSARSLSVYAASADTSRPFSARPTNSQEINLMWTDPIVEETHKLRDEYAAQHGYNSHRIAEDLRRWEKRGFPMTANLTRHSSRPFFLRLRCGKTAAEFWLYPSRLCP